LLFDETIQRNWATTSRDYACDLKRGQVIPTYENLSNLFGYFKAMRTFHAKLRDFDWDGQVHLAKGKTDGFLKKGGKKLQNRSLPKRQMWGVFHIEAISDFLDFT
jgi:hypothetical protein